MSRQRAKRPRPLTADLSLAPALPEVLAPVANWQTLLALVSAHAFDELEINVALWIRGDWWYPLVAPNPGVTTFEYAHGKGSARWAYNARSFRSVHQKRRSVRGEHAGFKDAFVPILAAREVRGILVAGPFSSERPSSAEVLRRWFEITRTPGRVSDPSFSQYLSSTLHTLTLEGPLAAQFERLLECFAGLISGTGDTNALASEAHGLRGRLAQARFAERMWKTARSLVDELTAPGFATHMHGEMAAFGLEQLPQHVVAGLLTGAPDPADPTGELLQRDAFQRACVDFAKKRGHMVSGRIGDNGVTFLVEEHASRRRTRDALVDLATQAATLARKFGFKLHVGICQAPDLSSLPARYRSARSAADEALSQGKSIVHGQPRSEYSAEHLRELRRKLAHSLENRPNLLAPRFSHYIDAALSHSGYRLEPTRAELQAGFERLAEPLVENGSLDRKSHRDLFAMLERTSDSAQTIAELVATYRSVVLDLEAALQKPNAARQERGTRRGASFVREHLSEAITLPQVAKVAGFAPAYLSRLFKQDQGITFARYIQRLRIERAREMLHRTLLSVEEVQKLCGFRTRTYFHRVFKAATGKTPAAYRGR